jgi:KipI family sensor histidine kinase inhibitor
MRASPSAIRFLPCGDTALTIQFGETIDAQLNAQVLAFAEKFEAARVRGVVELVPTFRSLTIHFDPRVVTTAALQHQAEALLSTPLPDRVESRTFSVPVCYDAFFGVDLDDVSALTGLCVADVIARHSAPIYRVYSIGFLPGFAYLGDLGGELVLPRRPTPRLKVPAGSVAMAMAMTGVYPLESPGGWHILGRTPVPMFDRRQDPPSLLRPGDKVKFTPVSAESYRRWQARAGADVWQALRSDRQ